MIRDTLSTFYAGINCNSHELTSGILPWETTSCVEGGQKWTTAQDIRGTWLMVAYDVCPAGFLRLTSAPIYHPHRLTVTAPPVVLQMPQPETIRQSTPLLYAGRARWKRLQRAMC